MKEILVGQPIGIVLDSAVGIGVVAGRYAWGRVLATTEKAIQIVFRLEGSCRERSIWAPRRALIPIKTTDGNLYNRAKWWPENDEVWKVLEMYAEVRGVSSTQDR